METPNFRCIPIKNRGIETGEYTKCSPQHYDTLIKYNWRINKNSGYVENIKSW